MFEDILAYIFNLLTGLFDMLLYVIVCPMEALGYALYNFLYIFYAVAKLLFSLILFLYNVIYMVKPVLDWVVGHPPAALFALLFNILIFIKIYHLLKGRTISIPLLNWEFTL